MMFAYVLKHFDFKMRDDFKVIMKYGFLYESKDNHFLYLKERDPSKWNKINIIFK